MKLDDMPDVMDIDQVKSLFPAGAAGHNQVRAWVREQGLELRVGRRVFVSKARLKHALEERSAPEPQLRVVGRSGATG